MQSIRAGIAAWSVAACCFIAACGDQSSLLPDGNTSTAIDAPTTATIDAPVDGAIDGPITSADARSDANFPDFQAISDLYAPINVGGVPGTATAVAVSPDGSQMIVVGPTSDSRSTRWTVELYTGAVRDTVVEIDGGAGASDSINETPLSVAFSPTGDSFVVVGYSQTENANNQQVQSWLVKRYSGDNYSTVEVIDSAPGVLGSAEAMSVAYSSDGSSFVVGGRNVDVVNSADCKWWVRLYSGSDFSTITDIETDLTDDYGLVTFAVGIAPDSSIIAAANSNDNTGGYWTVRRYSGSDFSTVQTLDQSQSVGSDFDDAPATMTFSPDGTFFVVVGWANPQFGIVKEYGGDGYGDVTVLDASAGAYLFGVAISPDGNEVIAAGHDGNGTGVVREYSGSNFSTVTTLFDGATPGATGRSFFSSAAYDPLSSSFVEVGGDGWLVQANSDSQPSNATAIALTASSPLGTSAIPTGVAFSPDGQTLAVVGYETFPLAEARRVVRTYTGTTFSTVSTIDESTIEAGDQVSDAASIAFSPDGQAIFVATSGFDGTNYDWSVRQYAGDGFHDVTEIVDSGPTATSANEATPVAIQVAPDGVSFVVVGDIDSLWTVKRYSGPHFTTVEDVEVGAVFNGGTFAQAQAIAFNPDGESFVVAGISNDSTGRNLEWVLRQYSGANYSTVTPIVTGSPAVGASGGFASAVAYAPDGGSVVVGGCETLTGSHGNTNWVIRRYSGSALSTVSVLENSIAASSDGPGGCSLNSAQFTPDGSALLVEGNTATDGWIVREYSGSELTTASTIPTSFVPDGASSAAGAAMAIAPRGDWFVSVGDAYTAQSGDVSWIVGSAARP